MEFSRSNPESQLLLTEAMSLIENQPDPVAQALMAAAAIEEGLFLNADYALGILDKISDEDKRDSTTVSPFQYKIHAAGELLEAYAERGEYADADQMLEFLKPRDNYWYSNGVTNLLEHGYGGPENRYLRFTAQQLKLLAKDRNPQYPERSELAQLHHEQSYMERYLCAVAQYGENVLEPGTEYSNMLFTIGEIAELAQDDSWQTQRRLTNLGSSYAKGRHLELALSVKDMITDHSLKADVCLDIARTAQDSEIIASMIGEITQQIDETARCTGGCDHKFCNPERDIRVMELGLAQILATKGDVERAKELAGEPAFHHPYDQLTAHLEVYKQSGEETARTYSLSFFNELTGYHRELLAEYLKEIAIADQRWGRIMPSPVVDTETVPLVCWQIRNIYPGLDKYARDLTGDESEEPLEIAPDISKTILEGRGNAIDATLLQLFGIELDPDDAEESSEDEIKSYGPLSSTFKGDELALESDLKDCQEQRDRAYATFAALMGKNGATNTAKQFLDFIDTPHEKVRGLVATARELAV